MKQVSEGVAIKVNIDVAETSQEETERNFLLLSVAYAANIGGTGVITPSPSMFPSPSPFLPPGDHRLATQPCGARHTDQPVRG
jgi:hypothetical protein